MKSILVKSDERVELTGKTVVAASTPAKKPDQAAERKPVSDPFFEVRSPRAMEGDKVTVTFAHC